MTIFDLISFDVSGKGKKKYKHIKKENKQTTAIQNLLSEFWINK